MFVGTMLYGYCNGFFGKYSFDDKRIEAIGADWLVARDIDGVPLFAHFGDKDEMLNLIKEWSRDKN